MWNVMSMDPELLGVNITVQNHIEDVIILPYINEEKDKRLVSLTSKKCCQPKTSSSLIRFEHRFPNQFVRLR